jgi:hypothetical protein
MAVEVKREADSKDVDHHITHGANTKISAGAAFTNQKNGKAATTFTQGRDTPNLTQGVIVCPSASGAITLSVTAIDSFAPSIVAKALP